MHQKVRNSAIKKDNLSKVSRNKMEIMVVIMIISEDSKSGKKFNPETHMESQDHLQNAIEYRSKCQKESVGARDSEPDNTYTENHNVDDENPRPRSEKVSAFFGSNVQICKEWIKTGACTVSYCNFKYFDPNALYVDNDRQFISGDIHDISSNGNHLSKLKQV